MHQRVPCPVRYLHGNGTNMFHWNRAGKNNWNIARVRSDTGWHATPSMAGHPFWSMPCQWMVIPSFNKWLWTMIVIFWCWYKNNDGPGIDLFAVSSGCVVFHPSAVITFSMEFLYHCSARRCVGFWHKLFPQSPWIIVKALSITRDVKQCLTSLSQINLSAEESFTAKGHRSS